MQTELEDTVRAELQWREEALVTDSSQRNRSNWAEAQPIYNNVVLLVAEKKIFSSAKLF